MSCPPGKLLRAVLRLSIGLLLFVSYAHAQPNIAWQAVFGGTNHDFVARVRPANDGGYFLGGYSESGVSGNKTNANFGDADIWIVKVDANGNKVWEQLFGGTGTDNLEDLYPTSDGGCILAGEAPAGISGNKTNAGFAGYDGWVIKLDSNGNRQWEQTFGGTALDFITGVQTTGDGGYILAASSESGISGNKTNGNFGSTDYWLVKLDSNGTKQWEKVYGGNSDDNLLCARPTSDGGYILGGQSASGVSGNKSTPSLGIVDYWVVKVDSNGTKQWDKSFGGNGYNYLRTALQTSDGGYLVAGYTAAGVSGNKTTPSFGGADYWVIKLDSSGNKLWEKAYGGSADDNLFSAEQTSDGGYIFGGWSTSGISGNRTNSGFGDFDYWLVKVDATGAKQWEKTLGGNGFEALFNAQPTSDEGFIVAGHSFSGVSGNKTNANIGGADYWLVKLGSSALTLICPTNKTVECGSPWSFDLPTAIGGCCSNRNVVVLNTVTNGSCPQLITRTWQVSDCCTNSAICSQTVILADTNPPLFTGVSNKVVACGSNWTFDPPTAFDTCCGSNVTLTILNTVTNGSGCAANIIRTWQATDCCTNASTWSQTVSYEPDLLGVEWQAVFGGSAEDYLRTALPTSDGGFILGGYSASSATGNKTNVNFGSHDYWLVKTDGNGIKQWEKNFGADDGEYLFHARQTTDGGYILGGYSASYVGIGTKIAPAIGGNDYWLVKVDGNGNEQWEQSYGGYDEDYLMTVRQTSDGGYILGGYSYSDAWGNKSEPNYGFSGYADFWLVKTDSSGNQQWDRGFGGNYDDYLYSVLPTSDGGYILGGASGSPESGNKTSGNYGDYDYWVIKLDANGNKQWEQIYGGDMNDTLFNIVPASDGGYLLTGYSLSGAAAFPFQGNKTNANWGQADWWVVKINATGTIQWQKAFGGTGNDILQSAQAAPGGGWILGGYSDSPVSGNKTSGNFGATDYWVVKIDDNGNKQWEKIFGGVGTDAANSVAPTGDGGYVIGGYAATGISGNKTNTGFGGSDYWLVKLKPTPPVLITPPPSSDSFTLRWSGWSGDLNVVIYASTNLPNWTPIFTNPPVNGSFEYTDPIVPGQPLKFYRVVLEP